MRAVPAGSVIDVLVDTVSRNGRMLLDVRQTSDSAIPDEARKILPARGAR